MAASIRTGDKYTGLTTELGTYVRVKVPLRECILWDDYEDARATPKPAPAMTSRLGGIDLKTQQKFPTTMERLPPRQEPKQSHSTGRLEIAPFPEETVRRYQVQ
eukprot:CAMPEP_0179070816 /NCGR_PEP_ID=MMETSP0796-20121207/31213_1 /TAXON_ID=73915 /ORGANISM="Pyrodinium bahamense, Strain pbaha01" /LENGTH=103 /DNA_ID=CAMNT_0020767915 /DNA_START=145 /DNA_END=456 /DNA_ORIENTATION=+